MKVEHTLSADRSRFIRIRQFMLIIGLWMAVVFMFSLDTSKASRREFSTSLSPMAVYAATVERNGSLLSVDVTFYTDHGQTQLAQVAMDSTIALMLLLIAAICTTGLNISAWKQNQRRTTADVEGYSNTWSR